MEAAILIGNGLNRCYTKTSWDELLQNIANEYSVEFNNTNSFPLEFESISNQILSKEKVPSDKIYNELKGKISENLKNKKPENLHKLFTRDLPTKHILTTNYDYMLEKSYSAEWSEDKVKRTGETRYSLYRKINIGKKNFYHIHGEVNQVSTICLGYEHYAAYLAEMRKYLKTNNKKTNKKKTDTKIQHIVNKEIGVNEKESWLNLFFTHDIYIVGLTLDPCEIDLWWLLTYRAYLYYSNDHGLKEQMKNEVTIFSVFKKDDRADIHKEKLFNNLHVKYIRIQEQKDYENTYGLIQKKINNLINERLII